MLNLRNLPGARFLYQILQNTYDALRRQFRRDSLVIEESTDAPADVTVKQKKRQPRRPSETHLWVRMFERLDTIMEIESKARMRETGRSVCGHSDFRRRHGSFVYFGAMNDFPTVVTHQHVFDLPGLFSLATGSHIDLARDKTLSPHMTLIKITGIKLEIGRAHV